MSKQIKPSNGENQGLSQKTLHRLSSELKVHIYNPAVITHEPINTIYIMPKNERRTSEIISEYEYARVVGERAQQLQNGAQPLVKIDDLMTEIEIAKLEIKLRMCPLRIRRMYNKKLGEEWSVNEMEIPF